MCGRVNVSDNEGIRVLLAMLGMDVWPSRDPRFNIAPTQTLDVISRLPKLTPMRWGIVPAWANNHGKTVAPLINARCETIREKVSFKQLINEQRAIIPINGFYEWLRPEKTEQGVSKQGTSKTAFYISSAKAPAMLLAGIWQSSANPANTISSEADVVPQSQVCVITTAANKAMSAIHHRMPVILDVDEAIKWLNPSAAAPIDMLMRPAANDLLQIIKVSNFVNNARHEGSACIEPAA
ncbi:MAG: SOS response-associated peptidase [Granulosicoccus sp.]